MECPTEGTKGQKSSGRFLQVFYYNAQQGPIKDVGKNEGLQQGPQCSSFDQTWIDFLHIMFIKMNPKRL